MEAIVKFDGKVLVEGQEVGNLINFDFIPENIQGEHSTQILSVARKSLSKVLERKVEEFINSSHEALNIDNFGNILWMQTSIARLVKGSNIYKPKVLLNNLEMLSIAQKKKIQDKCEKSINEKIKKLLSKCMQLKNLKKIQDYRTNSELELTSKVKAVTFNVYEGAGHAVIKNIPFQIQKLDQKEKLIMAKLGLRIGVNSIYLPDTLKPKVIKIKSILWSIFNDISSSEGMPEDGRVNCKINHNLNKDFYIFIGYIPFSEIAFRVDIFERLLALIRIEAKKVRFNITDSMLSIAGTTRHEIKNIILSMKYELVKDEKSIPDHEVYIFQKKFKKKKSTKKNFLKKKSFDTVSKININSPFYVLKSMKK